MILGIIAQAIREAFPPPIEPPDFVFDGIFYPNTTSDTDSFTFTG